MPTRGPSDNFSESESESESSPQKSIRKIASSEIIKAQNLTFAEAVQEISCEFSQTHGTFLQYIQFSLRDPNPDVESTISPRAIYRTWSGDPEHSNSPFWVKSHGTESAVRVVPYDFAIGRLILLAQLCENISIADKLVQLAQRFHRDPFQLVHAHPHLIPAFAHGPTERVYYASLARRKDEFDDWRYHYVNFFADRDMFMRYLGGGVGHYQVPVPDNEETEEDELPEDDDEDDEPIGAPEPPVRPDDDDDDDSDEEDLPEEVADDEVRGSDEEDEDSDDEGDPWDEEEEADEDNLGPEDGEDALDESSAAVYGYDDL